jgi:hypothetical protein
MFNEPALRAVVHIAQVPENAATKYIDLGTATAFGFVGLDSGRETVSHTALIKE